MGIASKAKAAIRSIWMMSKEEKKVPIPMQVNTTTLLTGKVALITGGSGGIGMAIANNFLKNGAKVIVAGTSKKRLEEAVNNLSGGGGIR